MVSVNFCIEEKKVACVNRRCTLDFTKFILWNILKEYHLGDISCEINGIEYVSWREW